ncbi:MAG TPA: MarR family winged helix-turn-helix transcriptional regulator [Acidimicrobiales bacterium]|nr:MarR family winged helix-turn-helix transcriptional regulator [Acidimicrobiales bacterium]
MVRRLQGATGRTGKRLASTSSEKRGEGRAEPPARRAWHSIVELFLFSPDVHERMQQMCDGTGFTPGLVKALLSPVLESDAPVPMRDLAGEWHCDPSYVTMQVRELEQRGLAERRFNPEDHRFKTVALTEKGVKMRSQLMDRLLQPPSFFGELTTAEQRQLRDLLQKLVTGSRRGASEAPAVSSHSA